MTERKDSQAESYANELRSYETEIKRLKEHIKKLKLQSTQPADRLKDWLTQHNKTSYFEFKIEKLNPPTKKRINKKEKSIQFFSERGITSPEEFWKDYTEKLKAENNLNKKVEIVNDKK